MYAAEAAMRVFRREQMDNANWQSLTFPIMSGDVAVITAQIARNGVVKA